MEDPSENLKKKRQLNTYKHAYIVFEDFQCIELNVFLPNGTRRHRGGRERGAGLTGVADRR